MSALTTEYVGLCYDASQGYHLLPNVLCLCIFTVIPIYELTPMSLPQDWMRD